MNLEQTLFTDHQTIPAAAFCPICGGECYAPGLGCLRCEGGMV